MSPRICRSPHHLALFFAAALNFFSAPFSNADPVFERLFESNTGSESIGSLFEHQNGVFVGSTASGGPRGRGTTFKVTASGKLTTFLASPIDPENLVKDSAGNLYGLLDEESGSQSECVFKISPEGVFTPLVLFNGSNGAQPFGKLIPDGNGNFYGITREGGVSVNAGGTIFKVTSTGTLTTVVEFTGNNGLYPNSLVKATDGNIYGTTKGGGPGGYGTAFRLTAAGVFTSLATFNPITTGYPPEAGKLVEGPDGNLYGFTQGDSTSQRGALFKLTRAGVLTSFFNLNSTNGGYPGTLLSGSDGNLYGTTVDYQLGDVDTSVFKITTSGAFTNLVTFNKEERGLSEAVVFGSDGHLYGVTHGNGNEDSFGTIFRVTTSGTFTSLHTFNAQEGGPAGKLLSASDGHLYGLAAGVFQITTAGVFTMIANLGDADGSYPTALVVGDDGNFYGATAAGAGPNGNGCLFKITPSGNYSKIAALPNFSLDTKSLTKADDGNFYGVSSNLFRVTPAGVATLLHSFVNFPIPSRLMKSSDGNLYGTTQNGGTGYGTLFRMSTGGTFATVASFTTSTGTAPSAEPVEGLDGNFYGSTREGGTNNRGTIYQCTPGGVLTTAASFTTSDGSHPNGPLIRDSAGNLYGTTIEGGTAGLGTIFKFTPGGVLTTLTSFDNTIAGYPYGLALGPDGNIYGTAANGGEAGLGCLFKMTPGGAFTRLYSFEGDFAANPYHPPIFGSDGKLYGTATQMVIWRLSLTAIAPAAVTGSASEVTTTGATLGGMVTANAADTTVSFQYGTSTSYTNIAAASPAMVTGNSVTAVTATLSGLNPKTTYHFRVVATNSQGTTNGADATFTTDATGNAPGTPIVTTQPITRREQAAGNQVIFAVEASGPGTLTYQWYKNGAAIRGATAAQLLLTNITAADAASYTCAVSNRSGKVKTEAALLTVSDAGPLIYKIKGSGKVDEGATTSKGSVAGFLVLDRAGQAAGFVWTGKQGQQKVFWTEQRFDVATHSTGPVPKSTTLVIGDTAEGDYPSTEHDLVWLRGSDALVKLSSNEQTVAPLVLAGTIGRLTLGAKPRIETLGVSLALDKAGSLASRLAADTVTGAVNKLKNQLLASGYTEAAP